MSKRTVNTLNKMHLYSMRIQVQAQQWMWISPLSRHEMEMDFARKCHRTVASTPRALRQHQASNESLPIIQVTCPLWRREPAGFQSVSLCGHCFHFKQIEQKIDFHRGHWRNWILIA